MVIWNMCMHLNSAAASKFKHTVNRCLSYGILISLLHIYFFIRLERDALVSRTLTCHFNDLMSGNVVERMIPGQMGGARVIALGEVRL